MATPDQKQRAKAAILGGLVADAASLGVHWVVSVALLNLVHDAMKNA
jgi:hypothetical protein